MDQSAFILTCFSLGITFAASACRAPGDASFSTPLREGAPALRPSDPPKGLDRSPLIETRMEILASLAQSKEWAQRAHASSRWELARACEQIPFERLLPTLTHLEQILTTCETNAEVRRHLREDFDWFVSAGYDSQGGGVLFTGYCTPELPGSLTPSFEYRFPLYGLPEDLLKDKAGKTLGRIVDGVLEPAYPDRAAIEAGFLKGRGLELVYLTSAMDAFIAHVNGSAFVNLPSGEKVRYGYAGKNGHEYVSIGRLLVERGAFTADEASLDVIRSWAAQTPEDQVQELLDQNPSFVFFQPIEGNPHGSLDVPVTTEHSVATDKSIFPPGAPVFVTTSFRGGVRGAGENLPLDQLMFDQDTGGAIQSAGRADLYMGIGPGAVGRAGRIKSVGQLYYFFKKATP